MTAKNNLFTIGEFSKITGIGIHSLRYYDEIGALRPEYVDPVSNYRYYGFDQLSRIPAINICLEAGIRLSEFDQFLEDGNVNYDRLLAEGRNAIDRKMDEYRQQRDNLIRLDNFLRMSAAASEDSCIKVMFEGAAIWYTPCTENNIADDPSAVLRRLSEQARKSGCLISPILYGLFRKTADDDAENYFFCNVQEITDPVSAEPHILRIDGGEFMLKACRSCSLDNSMQLLNQVSPASGTTSEYAFTIIGSRNGSNTSYAAVRC